MIAASLQRLGLLYVVALFFVIWGFVVGHYHIFPYQPIANGLSEIEAFFQGVPEDEKSAAERLLLHRQEANAKYSGTGFTRVDPDFVDPGYLLLSRFEKTAGQVIVELVRLSDFEILHTWTPPIEDILEEGVRDNADNSFNGYRAQHPILLDDGSLAFSSGEGPLVRINKESELTWLVKAHFHHSIEFDHLGRLVVPVTIHQSRLSVPGLRDDGYAVVGLDGTVIEHYSLGQILLDNGYDGLFLGVGVVEKDRLHINDAQPIFEDSGVAEVGDIAFSIRHLSTVLLYRPSTGKIVWLKSGPWLNQHDINLLPDGRYSIFGNDMFRPFDGSIGRLSPYSEIYIYDPVEGSIETPYKAILERIEFVSHTEGRSKILPNGDLYVEETNYHRIFRLSADTVRWQFTNGVTEKTSGALHWCRYMHADEVNLSWLNPAVSE